MAALSIMARIFQASASMPAASAAGSFCLMASSAHAEARALDLERHQHADDHERERKHHVDALVVELGVGAGSSRIIGSVTS